MKLSASQVSKFLSCPRAYAFEYVEGKRPPSSPKQQFGKDVHSQLENWLRHATPPDDSAAGRVAEQGIRSNWLPVPGEHLMVEKEFLIPWFDDVQMYGFVDCCEPGSTPLIIDHKSTSSLKWAKTVEELKTDPQALIYSLWAALEFRAPEVRARWIYYSASNPKTGPRRPTGALPVETTFVTGSSEYIEKVERLIETTEKMVLIRKDGIPGMNCSPNPKSCNDYGGCFHREYCGLSADDSIDAYFR